MTFDEFTSLYDKQDDEGGCWLWKGHSRVWVNGKSMAPMQALFVFSGSQARYAGKIGIRRCEETTCINPDHREWMAPELWGRRHKGNLEKSGKRPQTMERAFQAKGDDW